MLQSPGELDNENPPIVWNRKIFYPAYSTLPLALAIA
jgi:hypothetical protein